MNLHALQAVESDNARRFLASDIVDLFRQWAQDQSEFMAECTIYEGDMEKEVYCRAGELHLKHVQPDEWEELERIVLERIEREGT